jgi:hypothetical protein
MVGRWGKRRSTCQTTKSWNKHNKISQETIKCKIIGMAIFGGDFRIGTRTHKIRLENGGGRLQIHGNQSSDPGWCRVETLVGDLSWIGGGPRRTWGRTGRNHKRNTQEQAQSHIH